MIIHTGTQQYANLFFAYTFAGNPDRMDLYQDIRGDTSIKEIGATPDGN